jgi:hypothetical protein
MENTLVKEKIRELIKLTFVPCCPFSWAKPFVVAASVRVAAAAAAAGVSAKTADCCETTTMMWNWPAGERECFQILK